MTQHYTIINKLKKELNLEVLLWRHRIGGILGALGHRFDPQPWHSGLRIWRYLSGSLGCDCSLGVIPGLGTPYAAGWPKKFRKRKEGSKKEIGIYKFGRVCKDQEREREIASLCVQDGI